MYTTGLHSSGRPGSTGCSHQLMWNDGDTDDKSDQLSAHLLPLTIRRNNTGTGTLRAPHKFPKNLGQLLKRFRNDEPALLIDPFFASAVRIRRTPRISKCTSITNILGHVIIAHATNGVVICPPLTVSMAQYPSVPPKEDDHLAVRVLLVPQQVVMPE
jgi:hypothetical protein